MLSLAAYLYEQYDMLPQRKADLFFNLVNSIIDEWDKARGIRRSVGLWKSPRDKLNTLSFIAFKQLAERTDLVDENVVQEWIGERSPSPPPNVCRTLAVETGLLAEEKKGSWLFVHKTIQEYLAAMFIVDSSLRPLELLNELDPDQRNRILVYLANMVSDNTNFVEQIIDEKKLNDEDKAEVLTTAMSEGMELDTKVKGKVYPLVGRYLQHKFSIAIDVDVRLKSLSVRTGVSSAKELTPVLFLIARLAKTKFAKEVRDIAKAVLPRTAVLLVDFVLNSSAFFITKSDQGNIEAANETKTDFSEK